jgi:hypothetical protein
MKKNIDNPIVQRMLKAFGFTKLSELYKLIGKTSQNINGMINRKTLIKNFEVELIKRNVNIDWIKTGQGEMMAGCNIESPQNSPSPGTLPLTDSINTKTLIDKTTEILKSDTIYFRALRSNIEAFHHALHCEREIDRLHKRVANLEDQMNSLQERLRSVSNG